MMTFNWLQTLTTIQTEQMLHLFLTAFLAQGRSDAIELSSYFDKKIKPRLERGNLIYAAFDNDVMIGFVLFEKWDQESYYLAEMAVLPEYQRQGIGKKLVFSIFDRDETIQKIVLVTEIENRWSHPFYEKIGFIRSSFQHPDYPQNFIGYECLRK